MTQPPTTTQNASSPAVQISPRGEEPVSGLRPTPRDCWEPCRIESCCPATSTTAQVATALLAGLAHGCGNCDYELRWQTSADSVLWQLEAGGTAHCSTISVFSPLSPSTRVQLPHCGQGAELRVRRCAAHFASRDSLDNFAAVAGSLLGAALARAEQTSVLESYRQQLQHAERLSLLGQSLSRVAHDLNNPLTCILASTSFLRAHGADCNPREHLEYIEESARRMRELVRQLLEFSMPRERRTEPLRLLPVVERALHFCQTELSEAGVSTSLENLAELPLVSAEPVLLTQVLVNLCLNACQAMSGSGGVITISGRTCAEDGVELDITDSGPGIPEQLLAQVFEPFFTTKTDGTGLGLAIVRDLMTAQRGQVQAVTKPTGGATLRLRIRCMSPVLPPIEPMRHVDSHDGNRSQVGRASS